MAYFNYFIKCIIRKLVNIFFKPKILFTILMSFCVFIGLKYYGFCGIVSLDEIPNSAGQYDNTPEGYLQYAIDYTTSLGLPAPDNYFVWCPINQLNIVALSTNNSTNSFYSTFSKKGPYDKDNKYGLQAYNSMVFRFNTNNYDNNNVEFFNCNYNGNNDEDWYSTGTQYPSDFTYYTNIDIPPKKVRFWF